MNPTHKQIIARDINILVKTYYFTAVVAICAYKIVLTIREMYGG